MSNPPSPRRTPQHEPVSPSQDPHIPESAASRSSPAPMSTLAIAATSPASQFYDPVRRHYELERPHSGHASHMTAAQQSEQAIHSLANAAALQSAALPTSQPHSGSTSQRTSQPPSSSSLHLSTSSRGRKAKAHVASACINCKRAHLSCDVSRPCTRCVSSGKQDTCIDVQHKKRGRPRLREEGEYKIEQLAQQSRPSSLIAAGPEAHSRPIAVPRHRRTESFRSIRSQGSEGSSPPHPLSRPQTALQPAFGAHFTPGPGPAGPSYEIPTAYLDLDLIVIKANGPFRQILNGGRDAKGRQLSEMAGPIDGESFHGLRTRLRAEREAREPVYMPPIMRHGHDPLLGASEMDVDRYTRGFDDRTYTWRRAQGGSAEQPFPARVRLGKANAYFVAVTLPSFRPVETPPQTRPVPPPYSRMHTGAYSARASTTEPPARAGFVPYVEPAIQPPRPSSQAGRPMMPQTAPRSHPPHQPSLLPLHRQPPQTSPYPAYQTPPSGTPRLSIAEPPTATTAFTTRSTTSRDLPPVTAIAPGVQLPPIMSERPPLQSPYTSAGPSAARAIETATQRANESDDDRQDTPKKRRRMDIDDVLHR